MKKLIIALIGIGIVFGNLFLSSYVLLCFWEWFIVASGGFGVDYAVFVGLTLMIGILRLDANKVKEALESETESGSGIKVSLCISFIYSLSLGIGYVAQAIVF